MNVPNCLIETDNTRRELVQHGTTMFPTAFFNHSMKNNLIPWHWHEDMEVGIVVNGEVEVLIDTEKYIVSEGDGFFVNSGVLHEMAESGGTKGEFYSIVFHPRLVGGNADSIFWNKYLQPLMTNTSLKGMKLEHKVEWQNEIVKLVEKAWENNVKEEMGYEFEIRHYLSRMIFLLSEYKKKEVCKLSAKAMRDETRIKRMIEYIQEHYSEEVLMEQIAKSASISESECLRCFRNTIGTTPIQFLKEFRLQKAAQLLNTTAQKVVDIGIQCGFQDMSYFAKTFRSVYGCTPSEYREKNKRNFT